MKTHKRIHGITAENGSQRTVTAHACFSCRKSFKVQEERAARCPDCGRTLHWMGRSFKPPARREAEQWRKVQALYAHGFRFFSYRSRPEAPPFPDRLRDVPAFVSNHPRHPFRIADPRLELMPEEGSGEA